LKIPEIVLVIPAKEYVSICLLTGICTAGNYIELVWDCFHFSGDYSNKTDWYCIRSCSVELVFIQFGVFVVVTTQITVLWDVMV